MFVYSCSRKWWKNLYSCQKLGTPAVVFCFPKGRGWENELFWLHHVMLAKAATVVCTNGSNLVKDSIVLILVSWRGSDWGHWPGQKASEGTWLTFSLLH